MIREIQWLPAWLEWLLKLIFSLLFVVIYPIFAIVFFFGFMFWCFVMMAFAMVKWRGKQGKFTNLSVD